MKDGATAPQQPERQMLPAPQESRCLHCSRITIKHLIELDKSGSAHPKTFLFPTNDFYRHHDSFQDLVKSASLGCDFCQLLVGCFKRTRILNKHGSISDKPPYNPLESLVYSENPEYFNQPLFTVAEQVKHSNVKIAIGTSVNDIRYMPIHGEDDVGDLLLDIIKVKVGDLPHLELRLDVHRDGDIWIDKYRIGRYSFDPDLGSRSNLLVAKQWLHDCQDRHVACRSAENLSENPSLPTRVLDIGWLDNQPTCRLFESAGQRGQYATLSHCWGGEISPKLTMQDLDAFCSAILISSLPASFRDAIHVTRGLGIRYLWIDALCILQDSKQDWELESQMMGSIYRDSTVTICASIARASNQGFIKAHSNPPPPSAGVNVSENDRHTSVTACLNNRDEEDFIDVFVGSDLNQRAWAFQEAVLSLRCLYFGSRQIYWRCPQELDSLDHLPAPCYPSLFSHYFPLTRAPPRDITGRLEYENRLSRTTSEQASVRQDKMRYRYYVLACEYAERRLTYLSDKFPAFSGLAERYRSVFDGEYLAGLWSTDFHNGLLWSCELDQPLASGPYPLPYLAPSWSWASSTTAPLYSSPVMNKYPLMSLLELVSWDVRLRSDLNPYGEVVSGHVVVKGLTKPLVRTTVLAYPHELPADWGNAYFDFPEGQEGLYSAVVALCNFQAYILSTALRYREEDVIRYETTLALDEGPVLPCDHVALAVGADDPDHDKDPALHGLILRQTGEAFQRVGYWQTKNCGPGWQETWQQRTLTLV